MSLLVTVGAAMLTRKDALVLALLLGGCAQQAGVPLRPAKQDDVIFTRYSPLSRTEEIARRTLTPLTFSRGQQALAAKGEALQEQSIDLSKEKFAVYVPSGPAPKNGYGLIVFIPPWSELTRPNRWRPTLDRHALIFVAAENSGNDATILDRRLPLTLLAYENVRAQYPIDVARVYVGGLSGGSKAALVTALAYPDVFRGALLNAGSEPIGGEEGIYLPTADLFRKFQQSKLVYISGESDEVGQREDTVSRASMRKWCVFNIEVKRARGLAHEVLDEASLDSALDALERPSVVDPDKLAECNERLQAELSSKLAEVGDLIATGNLDGARGLLKLIDGRYAGLADKAILDLDAKLSALEQRSGTAGR